MRKPLATLAALSLVLGTGLQPRPAHAIVGLATGGATAIPGGILLGLGLGIGLIGVAPAPAYCSAFQVACGSDIVAVGIVGTGLMIIIGAIMLEDSSGGWRFRTLDAPQAQQLGLTAAEQTAYNSELEEINSIADSANADLAAGLSQEDLHARYADLLSPLTLQALDKIL